MTNKIRAVRRIQFCSGHRVHEHESKCATLHGHNYIAFFHASAPDLDSVGRVIDFSVLKQVLGGWIDEHWDHTMVLYEKDEVTIKACKSAPSTKPVFILPLNPTAENMAKYLLETVCPKELAGTGITIEKVVIWETENCFAEVTSAEDQ